MCAENLFSIQITTFHFLGAFTVESHIRSIVKALTWRVIATLVTIFVAWIILGDVGHALEIGLLDTVIKLGAYYGHERVWDKIALGKKKVPEYYI